MKKLFCLCVCCCEVLIILTCSGCSLLGTDAYYEVPESEIVRKTPLPTMTPTPTTSSAISTPAPTAVQAGNMSYDIYTNTVYGFVCPYPTEFYEETNSDFGIKKTYLAKDDTAVMDIGAKYNTENKTVQQLMNDFIDEYSYGTLKYKANGETWYAMTITDGYWDYYRKCFVRDGKIYWFDFNCENDSSEFYSEYINYIEDNFKRID